MKYGKELISSPKMKYYRISSPRNPTRKRLLLNYNFMNFVSHFDYETIKIMQNYYILGVGCN